MVDTSGAGRVVRRLPDRPALTAVIAGLLALLFVGAVIVRSDGDVSRLVHAAPPWTDQRSAPGSLTVQGTDDGFDGQFFYRIAVAPLDGRRQAGAVRFDLPALRNARWLYGALAWAGSGGDRDLAPWAMVAVNVAAAVAVGALAGALAQASGRHAAWGLMLALYPGFAYSLSLDTSELVAAAFVLGGLLALRRNRWAIAAAALSCAVLTRDTTVVVPVGVAMGAAWVWLSRRRATTAVEVPTASDTNRTLGQHRSTGEEPSAATAERSSVRPGASSSAAMLAAVVPLAVFVAWQLVQRARFGDLPLTSSGSNNLSAPFRGLVHDVGSSLPPNGGTQAFRLLSIAVLLAVIAAAAVSLRESGAPVVEKAAWVPAVVVVCLLNAYLWSGATAFMRASTEAYLLSALVLLGSRRRWTDLAAFPVGGLWLLTAAAQVGKVS